MNSELFGQNVVVFGPSRGYKPVFFFFFLSIAKRYDSISCTVIGEVVASDLQSMPQVDLQRLASRPIDRDADASANFERPVRSHFSLDSKAPFTRRRCENDRYEIAPIRKEIFPDRPPVYTKTIHIHKLLKTIRRR